MFLRRMKVERRVPLDEQTYNIAIELCKECGEAEMAAAVFEQMKGDGVRALRLLLVLLSVHFSNFPSPERIRSLKGQI